MIDKVFNKTLWHPWLFAIYYVVFPFLINIQHLLLGSIVKPFVIVLGGTMILFSLFFVIFKEARFASILTSIFLISFFSYPSLYRLIQAILNLVGKRNLGFESIIIISKYWIILSFPILFFLFFILNKKSKHIIKYLIMALNGASILLIVVIIGYGLTKSIGVKTVTYFQDSWAERVQQNAVIEQSSSGLKRDIYLIVMDGYASSEVLDQIYGYDNSWFENELIKLGFQIIPNGKTNYNQTRTSFSSMLNMQYLDNIAAEVGSETVEAHPLAYMIQKNLVASRLRNEGYTVLSFPSGYEYTERIQADIIIKPDIYLDNFSQTLIWNTVAYPYLHQKLYDWHRNNITHTISRLGDLNIYPSPKFVIAHLIAPHPPFVFEREGNPITPPYALSAMDADTLIGYTSKEYYKSHYAQQLEYTSHEILLTIKNILSHSNLKPIIILCGDHGPSLTVPQSYVDLSNQYERMHILDALYLPELDPEMVVSADHTPVNTFRIIFNEYFGDDLPLLDNKSFVSSYNQPYHFLDVTGEVDVYQPAEILLIE